MKFKVIGFSIIVCYFYLISCNYTTEKKVVTETTQEVDAPQLDIMLVDNTPWDANPETTEGIIAMQKHLQDYKRNPDSYPQLKQRLENEFSLLVQNCTMKGEAHDQLHNYLVPITVYFEELGSTDKETAKAGFEKLEQHLGVYTVYFK